MKKGKFIDWIKDWYLVILIIIGIVIWLLPRSSNYTLTSDKEGIFFLLSEDSFNDKVDIYIEI